MGKEAAEALLRKIAVRYADHFKGESRGDLCARFFGVRVLLL